MIADPDVVGVPDLGLCNPEHGCAGDDGEEVGKPAIILSDQWLSSLPCRRLGLGRQFVLAQEVDSKADHHTYGREAEADMPAIGLSQGAGHQGCDEGPEIDDAAIDLESNAPPSVLGAVKFADLGGHIAPDKARADDQKQQGHQEGSVKGERQMACGHGQCPDDDAGPAAKESVAKKAANERGQGDQAHIKSEYLRGEGLG